MSRARAEPGRRAEAARTEALARPGARSLAALVLLGLLASLVSLFLWMDLVLARTGGPSVCGPEDARCGALWDGALATAVHGQTGLPVAAWGLVWGVVATALPLLELLAQAERRPSGGLVAGVRLTAAAGAAVAIVLVGSSLAAGAFCLGCLATHLLVAGYAGIALVGWRGLGFPEAARGAVLAGGLVLALALLLVYPGQRTPRAPTGGASALARAVEGAETRSSPTRDPERDRQLHTLVAGLSAPERQALSDSLAVYRNAPAALPARTRAAVGPPDAPVRITEFTDVRCPHCAELHHTLQYLREQAPPGSFLIEPRQFPLDAACNPQVRRTAGDLVRCLAARAQVCLEGHPRAFDYAAALFQDQRELDAEKVYALARAYRPRAELERCVGSPATQARIEEDAREATRHQFDGTPLVLVNGRKGSSFGPFLYAMILAEGHADHAAFAGLPPPRADAHVH